MQKDNGRPNQWPTITDAEGRSLMGRAGDLRARFMLNDLAGTALMDDDRSGCCTLIHAERYLSDRLAYELYPWPKWMILAANTEEASNVEG